MSYKKVIDADNQKILQYFQEQDTEDLKNRYQALGIWNDISVDRDGDIILWKQL